MIDRRAECGGGRARIADVGRRAGVSSRTVLRVLHGGDRVAPSTRERVRKALEELDYRPHLLARGLRLKRTNLIGVLTPSVHMEVLSKKLAALEEAASRRGLRVLLGVTRSAEAVERQLDEFVNFCDAVAVIGDWARSVPAAVFHRLAASGMPYVAADEGSLAENAIAIDRGGGIVEALGKLHDRYRYYTYLADPAREDVDPRGVAFRRTLERLGKSGFARVHHGESGWPETGYAFGDRIAGERPHLVCCQNDRIAMGLLKRLLELGVDVPLDVGIVGYDDDTYARFAARAISTIAQPVEALAVRTLEMVELELGGTLRVASCTLPTTFIPRETTP